MTYARFIQRIKSFFPHVSQELISVQISYIEESTNPTNFIYRCYHATHVKVEN